MSKKNKGSNTSVTDLLESHLSQMLVATKKSNKHAAKRNRLAKHAHQQSVLNYEQAERQYLIEKSRLQPSFKLAATELLACEPDFLNDPEQAAEAKYIADLGVNVDERVLRIKIQVKGEAEYLQPNLIIQRKESELSDERVGSLSKLLYFIPMSEVFVHEGTHSIDVYFVYFDMTTLPVIHKYQLTQQKNSALQRWDSAHLDTVYITNDKAFSELKKSSGCATLFINRC